MIAARFRAMTLVAGATASALAFYMVTLRVSSERAAVDRLKRQIVVNLSDMRNIESELGTRARMPELERWNAEILALSAPKANQYLNGEVALASYLDRRNPAMEAEVRQAVAIVPNASQEARVQTASYQAAAPAAGTNAKSETVWASAENQAPARPLLHSASYKVAAASDEPRAILSDNLLGEIRKVAATESQSLGQAKVR